MRIVDIIQKKVNKERFNEEDINTVIGVIEDRVNTMIDERKW